MNKKLRLKKERRHKAFVTKMNPEESNNISLSISKDDLAKLPAAEFSGNIHIIDDTEKLIEAISKLKLEKTIGFDTETKPCFKKGQVNKVALIQLSTMEDSYLFRINKIGFDERIIDLLTDTSIKKVGLSLHDDISNLCKITSIAPESMIDLQNYVKQFRIADSALSKIHAIIFGERISKGQRLTNWEADELTELQQKYAALDAFACLKIYNHLSSGEFDYRNSIYIIKTEPETSEDNIQE